MLAIARQVRNDQEGAARCWTLIKRAILTHDSLPGEKLQTLVSNVEVIQDFQDAYGYSDVKPPRFTPSPRDVSNMLPALGWLCWLRRQNNGNRDFKLIIGRARNVPWWRLAQRFGRCEKQTQRWFDGGVAAVYGKFDLDVWLMEPGK